MILTEQDPRLLGWASERLEAKFDPKGCSWISHVRDEVEAVVVYTRFSEHNLEMSIATDFGRTWATKAFLRTCYLFPFVQLGKKRVTVVIEDDNTRSLELCRRLGHTQEGVLKQWFGDKDGILMRMTRQECRWI